MTAELQNVMRNLHFVDVWREMYPTSRIFSCYTPTPGAYRRLDSFRLANDGLLEVRRVVYQGTATARGIAWEALKEVIRGESLSKTYGIRKRLDQELTRQEYVLAALQCQVDNGDALKSDCLEVRGRIVDLWDRLDNYVRRNYRQRLFREGDRSGCMLAWLLRQERPIPIIQMLRGHSGKKILGQLRDNLHLQEHLQNIYATPCGGDVTWIREYLDGLRMPRLTEAQSEELEGEVSLDDLALGSCYQLTISYLLATYKVAFWWGQEAKEKSVSHKA
ncbi:hypothetical protein NDU88_002690 [Pleurodeles waltl]|uniref:Uncharacterized protein n=1 Tax=Pleurodeles waltl TaxID=8319 RepID=A0AAV7UD37_PLEWA|nr:hypothetical protein NDU88_002690 [Pleurodeles waltl]